MKDNPQILQIAKEMVAEMPATCPPGSVVSQLLHALDEQTDEAARLLVEFAKPALEHAVKNNASVAQAAAAAACNAVSE